MKLAELGLKTKPATKYFDHGYISFWSELGDLFYEIYIWKDKTKRFMIESDQVKDKQHLKDLFAIKTVNEVVNR